MGIPVNALKDDELLHYAALDPEAAAELQRRFADGSIDPGRESEELRDEIRHIESSLEDQSDEIENLQTAMHRATDLINQAMQLMAKDCNAYKLLKEATDQLE
jgi:uncharacterized phage infection (PIP) family protein YhgE